MTPAETVEVTQADREAAYAYWLHTRSLRPDDYRALARKADLDRGDCDGLESVQAFARHRIDSPPAQTGVVEDHHLLEEVRLSIECAAGCDEGVDPDIASSEVMSFGGSSLAVAYDKVCAALASAKSPGEGEGFPAEIGRLRIGDQRSDGERLCSHCHDVPAGHPLYWPERMGEYPDDVDPLCLEHAIEQAVADNGWCDKCCSDDDTRTSTPAQGRESWEANVRFLLDNCPHTIRCHEGGGPEDLVKSLVLTFGRMQRTLTAAPAPEPSGREADSRLQSILSLLGNVDHSHGGGEHAAKIYGGMLESIREIATPALTSPAVGEGGA